MKKMFLVVFVLCALNANNADFSKAQELVAKKDYEGACELFTKICHDGSLEGCKKAIEPCKIAKDLALDSLDEDIYFMNIACDKGHAKACYEIATELYSLKTSALELDESIEALSKGCALNHGASCAFLGDIYGGDDEELNKAVEYASKTLKAYLVKENYLKIIDKNKANEYYKKACELSEKRACERL